MTFSMPMPNGPRSGRRSSLPLTISILVVLGVIAVSLSGFYADFLWFRSVDFLEVWQTTLFTRAALFAITGGLTALLVLANVLFAYRARPVFAPLSIEADNLERYRSQIEPIKRVAIVGGSLAIFYFAGSAGSQLWKPWLVWRNATPFGNKDPQFNLDISFFAFKLPFYQALVGWFISTIIIGLIAATVVHYLYGGIRPQGPGERTTVAARVQLSVLLGFIVLAKAVAYWFDRYALALKDDRIITGLTYTDVNAVLPGITDTPMQEHVLHRLSELRETPYRELEADRLNGIPMKRAAQPAEIAGLIHFLITDEAKYITGQALSQDGGSVMF